MQQLPLGMRQRERSRFENFIPGDNSECVQALGEVAAGRGGLYLLTGAQASGKTHLLLATLAAAQARGRRAQYLPLRDFALLGAASVAAAAALDLVCCDDVDVVASDGDFCRALFLLWRALESRGAALVLALREPLSAVHWALPDLGSRVLGQSQGFALRALPDTAHGAVLAQWAAARGLQLPADTLQYLLARLPRDLGELSRAFDTLDAAAWVAQRRLTVPFVRATLELDREV